MRYTLLNRFRGALLGAAAAEKLVAAQFPSVQPKNWTQDMLHEARSLLQEQTRPSFASPTVAGVALVTLPIALFYHEEPLLFHATLKQWLTVRQVNPELAIGAQLVGGALSRILRERLAPDRLIAELIAELDLPEQHPDLAAQLQAISAEGSVKGLSEPLRVDWLPIEVALSRFLATPSFFQLSVLRAIQAGGSEGAAIAAALSGAYSGATAIPRGWLRSIDATEIDRLAEQLVRQWSGMEVTNLRRGVLPTEVTAAPRVIRPR